MKGQLRVLIVGDQGVFGEALAYRLAAEPDLQVAANHRTVSDAVQFLSAETVDVVLLDYQLRDRQGPSLITWAANRSLNLRFLILTASLTPDDAAWLIRRHVAGICLKENPLSTLLAALRVVASGGNWLDQPFLKLVVGTVGGAPTEPPALSFTEREQAALRLLIEGRSNKEIGVCLKISEIAVKSVIQKLFGKTGVRSRSQLVRIALQKYQDSF